MTDATESTYLARNRRLCMPPILWTTVEGVEFYADDADERDGKIVPFSWGCIGREVRVMTHLKRFTLCDDRGRFLKWEHRHLGESKRRVRTFRSMEDAAKHLLRFKVMDCA